MSHLTYASTVWDGCSENTFKQLNSIHRRAVKHLTNNHTLSTDDKLKAMKILPLKKHLEFKKIAMIHKIYNDQTPEYLSNFITKATDRYSSMNLIVPKPKLDLYKTSLSFSGSNLWNNILDRLKSKTSFNSFKRELKEWITNQ